MLFQLVSVWSHSKLCCRSCCLWFMACGVAQDMESHFPSQDVSPPLKPQLELWDNAGMLRRKDFRADVWSWLSEWQHYSVCVWMMFFHICLHMQCSNHLLKHNCFLFYFQILYFYLKTWHFTWAHALAWAWQSIFIRLIFLLLICFLQTQQIENRKVDMQCLWTANRDIFMFHCTTLLLRHIAHLGSKMH